MGAHRISGRRVIESTDFEIEHLETQGLHPIGEPEIGTKFLLSRQKKSLQTSGC
jgi:hypothetical protein